MSKTLGLDLGITSIGWCLIEDNKQIIANGVRVFPLGLSEDQYNKGGKEVSKNVDRRTFRGARRRRFRLKLRQALLIEILNKNKLMPQGFLNAYELYKLRADGLNKKLSLSDFGRILMVLNKRRGFKSNRKSISTEEAKKEEGVVKEGISKLQKQIEESHSKTVGEYFFKLFIDPADKKKIKTWRNLEEPLERIRNRWVGREMYVNEFDLLWETQKKYYPSILTEKLRTKIRDEVIYYQRNLKSQKGLVGKCRFEQNKRCAPKSSVLFQEFRIRQTISNIRFASGKRINEPITKDETEIIFNYLCFNVKITEAKFKSLLGLPRETKFNDVIEALKGNTTKHRLAEALGEDFVKNLTDAQLFEFWHILSYCDNTEKLIAIVKRKIKNKNLPSLTDEQIQLFSEINLEEGFCNFSEKSLKKIIPFMRDGFDSYTSFEKAGYDASKKITSTGKIIDKNKISPLKPNELRNPMVQQMLGETFRVVNSVINKYGKPNMIRVELARELKKPKNLREQIKNKQRDKSNLRNQYAEFLTKKLKRSIYPNSPEIKKYELWLEMGCSDDALNNMWDFFRNGKVTDKVKYNLWLESGRISPYSGKVISLNRLFSSEIEIEHILPYSQTMNSEFTNLCLCEREINLEKGNKLPYEYFLSKGNAELEKFKHRVAKFGESKRNKFLAKEIPPDFLQNALNNTSYAARELAFRLQEVLPPIKMEDGKNKLRVQVVNGQATSSLRRLWGLNAILSYGDIDTKNRLDHRHHAIDALTIACTTPKIIHGLSKESKFRSTVKNDLKQENKFISNNPPWEGFLDDAATSINSFIVSYRNQKKLITTKTNKILQKNLNAHPDGFVKQKSISIRGQMHEETLYGQNVDNSGNTYFVTRWPITKFAKKEQLLKVVDKKVREILLERVERFGGDVKKAFEENTNDPVLMFSKKGKTVPIKKVRVINNSKNLILIRKETNTFVESGNNYALAIYKNQSTGKKDFETVTFHEAIRRGLNKEPIIQKTKDGSPLLFALKQKDIVALYKLHPDEINWDDFSELRKILYRVRKFDVNGLLVLDYLFASKIDDKNDRNKLFFNKTPGSLNCIRIEVNELGEITKKEGL